MSDRELLEAAARAAGLGLTWGEKYKVGDDEIDCTDIPYAQGASPDESPYYWNPLTDDGDEARLEAEAGLDVLWFSTFVQCSNRPRGVACTEHYADHGGDRQAARRRAGTRAAAAIGGRHG